MKISARLRASILFFLAGPLFAGLSVLRALELDPGFGDGMVLQLGQAAVSGLAAPGAAVKVVAAGRSAAVKAGADGRWRAALPWLAAGGPYELKVEAETALTLKDVLVGEVWFAAGQSNMELELANTRDPEAQLAGAALPQVRYFSFQRRLSGRPEDRLEGGEWRTVSPATAGRMSAAAFHFAAALHKELKVPVGVIQSVWGGTAAEPWTPRDLFESEPALKPMLEEWNARPAAERRAAEAGWEFSLEMRGLKFTGPAGAELPVNFSGPGPAAKWSVDVTRGSTAAYTASAGTALLAGALSAGAWGNFRAVLEDQGRPPDLSAYDAVEAEVRGRGTFDLTLGQPDIKDYDDFAGGKFTAGPDWVKARFAFAGLKQGGWGQRRAFAPGAINRLQLRCQPDNTFPRLPGGVYNSMVSPFRRFPVKGFLWYQGESNTGRAAQYADLLTALIGGWRRAWGGEVKPFILVQLPGFGATHPAPAESDWAELREAQQKVSALPGAAMAVALDLGDPGDIHPRDKREVGRRLALAALREVYGRPNSSAGPSLRSFKREGARLRLEFGPGARLAACDGKKLTGFAAAGEDRAFGWADAFIEGNSVVLSAEKVAAPAAARYAWDDTPAANLCNADGFPAAPFRTDAWPRPGR